MKNQHEEIPILEYHFKNHACFNTLTIFLPVGYKMLQIIGYTVLLQWSKGT